MRAKLAKNIGFDLEEVRKKTVYMNKEFVGVCIYEQVKLITIGLLDHDILFG